MPGKNLFSFSLTLCGALSFSVGFPAFLSFSVGFRRIWTSAVPIASPHHLNLDNNKKAKKNFNLSKTAENEGVLKLYHPCSLIEAHKARGFQENPGGQRKKEKYISGVQYSVNQIFKKFPAKVATIETEPRHLMRLAGHDKKPISIFETRTKM